MANGSGMTVVGEADIRVSYGKFVHETTALVCSDVRYSLLLSWHDLQFLDVLPRNFPASVSATVSDSIRNSILGEFPEVFKDTLSATPMNCPPMKIHLVEDYVPYCISTPRQVPLRFQEMVDAVIADLMASKVIAREEGPSEWCSPAFFVPKPDGKRVRLVTDYTKLNKYVKRPVHPFPSVQDIVQSIPAGSRFFAKMDAIHGYFQLSVEEESSKITTFLRPSGRYRYLPEGSRKVVILDDSSSTDS